MSKYARMTDDARRLVDADLELVSFKMAPRSGDIPRARSENGKTWEKGFG